MTLSSDELYYHLNVFVKIPYHTHTQKFDFKSCRRSAFKIRTNFSKLSFIHFLQNLSHLEMY